MGKRRIDGLIPLSAYDGQRKRIQHCAVRSIACRLHCLARPSRQFFVEMQLDLFVTRTGKQSLREPLLRIIFKLKIFSQYCEIANC